jgi:hypothetical protein
MHHQAPPLQLTVSPRQSPYERALDACIGDDAERRVCQWVAQRIAARRNPSPAPSVTPKSYTPFEVLPELIFRELDSCDESYYSKIIDALHKMSMHSIGMLDMRYEWHEDSDDILKMPVPVEGREVANALRTGMMYSPVSGEPIRDFSSHVHIIYMARTDKDPYQVFEE